jgi:hypothetical protein
VKYKLRTLRKAMVSTAARLQLAVNTGAKLTELDNETFRSSSASLDSAIASSSLEPIAVLTLLRVYGYQWDTVLYAAAAEKGDLELIKWLQQVQRPIAAVYKIAYACCRSLLPSAVSILQWLYSLQPDWFNNIDDDNVVNKTTLLYSAGDDGNFAVMQWLRCELQADWPSVADIIRNDDAGTHVPSWRVDAAIWALDNSLEFEFECSKLDPEKQPPPLYREQDATVLWEWLHNESNRHRCTCSNAVV